MEHRSALNVTSLIDSSESEDGCAENEIIEEPKVGMLFGSREDVLEYYKVYAKQVGFGVTKRSQTKGDGGELRYFVLVCSQWGKRKSKSDKLLESSLSIKKECKARIRAALQTDGEFKLTTVVLEHNHALTPKKSQYFRSDKILDNHVKRRLELNDQAGIHVCKNFNSLVVEPGGYDKLPFVEKDCRNYIEKARRLKLGVGDAEAIQNYFIKMQDKNSSFFYVTDFDEKSRIRNFFWADARSRATYEAFGDVVLFDTTYLTNKYDMPFAPFIGVNHHGQSVLLGCGLLSNEDIETFVWLFESWLACMSGCPPKAIITDQCKVMKRAIEMVFPDARHRWCLWHIMKKVPKKLRGCSQYEGIKMALQNVVYDSLNTDEFEEEWRGMIEKFDLHENEWLKGLYDERHRWVPVYVKDTFWAGMSTTQRSESMNAFFDGYVNSKTTLKQFVEQYNNALRSKFEKEKQADFHSFNSVYNCITFYDIEKQFQGVYTNVKFRETQEEFKRMLYCRPSLIKEEGSICTYKVEEDYKIGDKYKCAVFVVYFNAVECEVQCICHLFEFKGIICSHSLSVLTARQVREVPPKYILSRWRKDLKREYTFLRTNYSDMGAGPSVQRYDTMCKEFYEVATLAADFEEKCNIVRSGIKKIKLKVLTDESLCGSKQVVSVNSPKCTNESIKMPNEGIKVLSPLVVHRKGRPPCKRKVSKVDQVVLKMKERRKKQTKNKGKQDEAQPTSHMSHISNEIGTQESLNLVAQPSCFLGGTYMVALPGLTQSTIGNEIGTQNSMGGSNQICGGGFLNLNGNMSQGDQSSFWSGGYVRQQVTRHSFIESNSQDVRNASHPNFDQQPKE